MPLDIEKLVLANAALHAQARGFKEAITILKTLFGVSKTSGIPPDLCAELEEKMIELLKRAQDGIDNIGRNET